MRQACRFLVPLATLLAGAVSVAQEPGDPALERQVDALLGRMTLAEKVGQLSQYPESKPGLERLVRAGAVGSVLGAHGAARVNTLQRLAVEETRLKVPLIFGVDVIHGFRTVFPVPLAAAASFDPELVERTERVAAREATAAGVKWTFAPMVDIARDPRWGRIVEGAGEDPYLGAALAAARVRGFQGAGLADPYSLLACPKHYVGYGAAEGGRDYDAAVISEQLLREVHLPPFRAAVAAGAATVMSAFNDLNGVPASANRHTLTEILRDEWRFGGFVVSDWGSVHELVAHGVAADDREAALRAITAGVDMDMASGAYAGALAGLVAAGDLPLDVVDEAVRRVLRVKLRAGLFASPYADPRRETSELLRPEHLALARTLAQESIVLLANRGGVLPLDPRSGTIAVVGPLAADQAAQLGSWVADGKAADTVTPLAGLLAASRGANVLFSPGVSAASLSPRPDPGALTAAPAPPSATGAAAQRAQDMPASIEDAVGAARRADVVVAFLGEPAHFSGEASSRPSLDLPGRQRELLEAVAATGKPVVLVLLAGRPLDLRWARDHVAAIVHAGYLGTQAGAALADVLFGEVAPSGRLPVSWPRSVGHLPVYYGRKSTGRPATEDRWHTGYQYDEMGPLFPFGYGLGYTTFAYGRPAVTPGSAGPGATVRVSAEIRNTGNRAGVEVVQLYVRDLVAPTSRPVRELKGFRRVHLEAGARTTVSFELAVADLAHWEPGRGWVAPAGRFDVWIAPDAEGGERGELTVEAAAAAPATAAAGGRLD